MSSPEDRLASTKAGIPLGQTGGSGTKRQRDDLDETNETESSPTRKKQRVDHDAFQDIWNFENLDDPAFFLGPSDLNIPDLDNGQFVVGSDGIEIPYTFHLQAHNYPDPNDARPIPNGIDDAANDFVLAPEPAIEFLIQGQSTNTGEQEEGDWPPPNWDGVLLDSIWDYLVNPMFEAQPNEPAPQHLGEDGMPCLTESSPAPPQDTATTPEGAKVQAEQTGDIGVLDEQPRAEPIPATEALDEAQFDPDLHLSSYLASYINSSDSPKTKATSVTSSESAPFDVQEDQNPLSGQMPFQDMFYDASFEPEPWAVQTEFQNVDAGNLHGIRPVNNYPLQYLEPLAGNDGDETQVEESDSSFSRPVPSPDPTNDGTTEESELLENHDSVTQGSSEALQVHPGLSAHLRLDMIASYLGRPLPAPTTPTVVASQALPDSGAFLGSRVPPIPARPTRVRARAGQSVLKATVAETVAPSDLQVAATLSPVASDASVPVPIPAPVSDSISRPVPAPAPVATPPSRTSRPPRPSPPAVLPDHTKKPTASCTRCHNKNNPQPCLPGKMTCVGCSSRRKSLRQQREEEGLCTTCGKQRDNDGKLTCGECRAKGRVRYAKGKGKERG